MTTATTTCGWISLSPTKKAGVALGAMKCISHRESYEVIPHRGAIREYVVQNPPYMPDDASVSYMLKLDSMWLGKVDLGQVKDFIVNFNRASQRTPAMRARLQRLGVNVAHAPGPLMWPLDTSFVQCTDSNLTLALNNLDDETAQFVAEHDLGDSVLWLRNEASAFFEDADFEMQILPAEDGEDNNILALKIYGAFSSSDFRRRRHLLCGAMTDAGHRNLYQILSVFQRRVTNNGWQAVSKYRSLSAG